MNWLKSLFRPLASLELAAQELIEAQRSLLASESAGEYADAMSLYHRARIERLSALISNSTKEPS
jgi:hypothetical protein